MEEDNCNSAEKRILKEFHEIESNPSDDFKCALLDWNIYEWQFALRGPGGTEFEGGIYHGRIHFSEEYPLKPPSFTLLTENGRFKTQTQIRIKLLKDWEPSWGVQDALYALIDEMPTYPDGDLAIAAPTYGTAERQKVIDEIHEYLLSKSPPVPVPQLPQLSSSQASNRTGGDSDVSGNMIRASERVGISNISNKELSMSKLWPKLSPSRASKGKGGMLERKRAVEEFDLPGSSVMEKDVCYSVAKGFKEEPDHLQRSPHSSGLKRILLEYDEIESNPSNDFKCAMLERNPYEWQFGIRGASGTKFEGGIYHGWIQFPEEYPSKPPSFTLLTDNGRFKTQNKIRIRRLNDWQPPWRVRDGLLAFIEEMPTYPDGDDELGSVEYNKEERRALAIKSRAVASKYGTAERQKVIDEIHEYLRSKPPPVPQLQLTRNTPCQEEVVVDRVGSTQMEWDRSVIAEEKRILEEYNEIESNPSNDFKCLKLYWNPYEWQFAIRGPSGTEFEGGIYHGVVQFSKGYPSKPPSIKFLTKNGHLKIHTDISSRLLLNWQSPRRVRDGLLALIEEMPTYPDGDDELDSIEYHKEERRALAIKSRAATPKYGTSERQKLIDEIHEYMLSNAPPVPQLQPNSPSQASKGDSSGILGSMNEGLMPQHVLKKESIKAQFRNFFQNILDFGHSEGDELW